MVQNYRVEYGTPNIVLIGVPNQKSLEKTLKKLKDNQIGHYPWSEPDEPTIGFSSIATIPIGESKKSVLSKYILWKPKAPGISIGVDPLDTCSVAMAACDGKKDVNEIKNAIGSLSDIPSE